MSTNVWYVCVLLFCSCGAQDSAYFNRVQAFRNQKNLTYKDPQKSPLALQEIENFKGLNYFKTDPSFKFEVQVDEYPFKQKVNFYTSKNKSRTYLKAARIKFTYVNQTYTLEGFIRNEADSLYFIPFVDNTTDNQTYASGRYVELKRFSNPKPILDFNFAYNPYCAYNKEYDCPIPPKENHLSIAIRAGEKIYKERLNIPPKKQINNGLTRIDSACLSIGLVEVASVDSSIQIDLKYSSTDNFVGIDMYGDFNTAYLHRVTAEKLKKAQQILKAQHPEYALIVFDAARPVHVQKMMWDSIDVPLHKKHIYVSNPDKKSLHNYGAAVDLSIIDLTTNKHLDMGTPYDYFGKEAYTDNEDQLILNRQLTETQVENRRYLRKIMLQAGFTKIKSEWWHFNTFSKSYARTHLKCLTID